ncbi:MAG TPA: hypothetical protein PJ982_02470 [Lacipirellulaceae bacterium]|nr:hypothetical protein [Lacipirellulaceae bacterium]
MTFENANVPTFDRRMDREQGTLRDVAKKMDVIDFYIFYNELIPDTIECFARVAREKIGPDKALGAFYGYMYEFAGDPEYGHNALEKFNRSPYLDFVYVTASYNNRQPGIGGDYARAPSHSVRLHNKLWYNDNDVVSFLAPKVMAAIGFGEDKDWTTSIEHHLQALGYTDTAERTRWMYRRSLGFAICHGAYTSYFDLHGGYYDSPELMEEVAALNQTAVESADYDRSSVSEILVVADEDSNAYGTFRSNIVTASMADTPPRFIKLGAPQDHILLGDLERVDPSQYKMIVFLNCYNVMTDERRIIEELKASGRTLVWCYAPGVFNGADQLYGTLADLTGMQIVSDGRRVPLKDSIQLVESDDPLGGALQAAGGLPKLSGLPASNDESSPTVDLFCVRDVNATVLGVEPAGREATMAIRRFDEWTSIYLLSPILPSATWRELARDAGVHIFSDRDDTFYANKSYLCLHGNGAGARTIRLPRSSDVRTAIGPARYWQGVGEVSLDLEHGETVLLLWQPRDGSISEAVRQ